MSKHYNTVATNDKNQKLSLIGHYNDNLENWEFWELKVEDLETGKSKSQWFGGNEFRAANEKFDEIL